MGTKNNPGKFDCYANAEPDEPMFILLGRDKHAPTLVWLWAVMRELDGEDAEKIKDALECALSMIAWAQEHNRETQGLGVAVLAGTLQLIKVANEAIKDAKNIGSNDDLLRRFLCETTLDLEK